MRKQHLLLCASLTLAMSWAQLSFAQKESKVSTGVVTNVRHDLPMDHPFYKALINTYNTSNSLLAAVRGQYAAAESVSQALAGWRPTLVLNGSGTRQGVEQQVSSVTTFGTPIPPRAYSTNYAASLVLSQNLYAGGSTEAGVASQRASFAAGVASFTNTEQQTLFASVQAYLDLCLKRATLELQQKNVDTKRKTLEQTRARMEVGELTLTDVEQTNSDYASALAQEVAAKADLITAEATYFAAIGEQPAKNLPLPEPVTHFIPVPKAKTDFVDLSLKNAPAMVQAMLAAQAAKHNIDVRRGALLPSVDLQGSLGRNITSDTVNRFSAADARSNTASVGVQVRIPLYGGSAGGGSDWSTFRQARQQATQAKITVRATEDSTRQSAVSAYESWISFRDQIPELEKGVEAARLALQGVQQESLVGERTILDVLTAENTLLSVETSLLQARIRYLQAGFQMLVSLGQLTAAGLALPVSPYPIQSYAKDVEGFIFTGYDPER
ncbi:MAG: hypothetical protein C0514_08675 [Candidatus Puniceispirillum sp.]|nr:hypothetical protein [Candidatus Puniceispirillum sp.]